MMLMILNSLFLHKAKKENDKHFVFLKTVENALFGTYPALAGK